MRELQAASGLGRTAVKEKLTALMHARLIDGQGRRAYIGRQRLTAAAEHLGVRGAHADKTRLYALHSAAFVWWLTDRMHQHLSSPSDALAEWGRPWRCPHHSQPSSYPRAARILLHLPALRR